MRADGRTLGVRLQSASATSVRLVNPFGDSGGYLGGNQIQPTTNGDLEVDLSAGNAVWLTAAPEIQPAGAWRILLVERPEVLRNPYGLKFVDPDWLIDSPDIAKVHPHFRGSFIE